MTRQEENRQTTIRQTSRAWRLRNLRQQRNEAHRQFTWFGIPRRQDGSKLGMRRRTEIWNTYDHVQIESSI